MGDRVRVERDEVLHPPRGTWPRYRGREGTVVVPANFGEVGVRWGSPDSHTTLSWFLPHELTLLRRQDSERTAPQEAR